jgi:hypothetical protein
MSIAAHEECTISHKKIFQIIMAVMLCSLICINVLDALAASIFRVDQDGKKLVGIKEGR